MNDSITLNDKQIEKLRETFQSLIDYQEPLDVIIRRLCEVSDLLDIWADSQEDEGQVLVKLKPHHILSIFDRYGSKDLTQKEVFEWAWRLEAYACVWICDDYTDQELDIIVGVIKASAEPLCFVPSVDVMYRDQLNELIAPT